MKIAFFGLVNSFDFDHIGGLDSLTRLLAQQLVKFGDEVHFVHYGAQQRAHHSLDDRLHLQYFLSIGEAFEYLDGHNFEHVVSIYVLPSDRLQFAGFRKAKGASIQFHHIYSIWAESRIKRELLFVEARLFPYNGYLFCLSPRFFRYVSQWSRRAAMLWPPVAEAYFCAPDEKENHGTLRIAYAGRVDPGKGTGQAIEVFRRLANYPDIEMRLSGYAWSHMPETVRLHESLIKDPRITYEPVEFEKWSPDVDARLMSFLRKTDILLLPYRNLSSTIDTPLLLLEGMANLCAIITPPFGDLHDTYGQSIFNLTGGWETEAVVGLVEKAHDHLRDERVRLYRQNANLRFDVPSVTEGFRKSLRECV